jgi:hypothetical protein
MRSKGSETTVKEVCQKKRNREEKQDAQGMRGGEGDEGLGGGIWQT